MSGFQAPNSDNLETGKSSYFNKHIPCVSAFRAPHLNRRGCCWLRCLCSPSLIAAPGVGECRGPHSHSCGTGCFPPATPPHSSEEATGLPDSRALLATWECIGCHLSERWEGGGAEEGEGQPGSRAGVVPILTTSFSDLEQVTSVSGPSCLHI